MLLKIEHEIRKTTQTKTGTQTVIDRPHYCMAKKINITQANTVFTVSWQERDVDETGEELVATDIPVEPTIAEITGEGITAQTIELDAESPSFDLAGNAGAGLITIIAKAPDNKAEIVGLEVTL